MPACLGSPPQSPQSHARLHQHALSLAHADLTLVSSSSRVQVLSKGVHTNVTSHPSFGTDNFVTMIATHAFRFAVPVRASASVRSTVRPVSVRASPVVRKGRTQLSRPSLRCRATEEKELDVEKEVAKSAKKIAETFAPRGSGDAAALGGKKNPAFKGSTLYTIFGAQAYLSLVVGALLSFNVILPSDQPDIARLMGMWSVWMFAVPSLRARECEPNEKEALNFLFIAIPLINVLIPIVWKSFPAVFTADCVLMATMYYKEKAGLFSEPELAVEAEEQ